MDFSNFSTEALRHELQLRCAPPATISRFTTSNFSDSSEIDEENDGERDEGSLSIHEQTSGRAGSRSKESLEKLSELRRLRGFGSPADIYDRFRQQSKKLPRRSNGDDRPGPLVVSNSSKRRRSYSSEMVVSDDELKPSVTASNAIARQERALSRVTYTRKKKRAARQENDRRMGERLAAEEEDDLLMLIEGQWTKACPGTKGRPIDLDYSTRRHDSRQSALSSNHNVLGNNTSFLKLLLRHQSETFDAAIARQTQRDEVQAREARLRETASRTRDCAVCGDATLVVELPSLSSCTHDANVCADCFSAWLSSQLEENGWQEVKCPGATCKIQLTYEEIKVFASKDVFERYDAMQARNVLSADPSFRWCQTPGCGSGQIHDVEEFGNEFVCAECHARFCVQHEGAYHDHETCEEYEYRTSGQKDRDERRKEDEASEEAIKALAKKCPHRGCGAPIQKNGGCNHITCKLERIGFFTVMTGANACRLEVST